MPQVRQSATLDAPPEMLFASSFVRSVPAYTFSMRRIFSLSLAHPAMVLVFTAAFALAGAVAFWHLPIERFPRSRPAGPGHHALCRSCGGKRSSVR